MGHTEELEKLIGENNGLITTRQAEQAGVPRKYLSLMVQNGKLERLSQGIYLSPDAFEDRLYYMQKRCNSGIFSHETALFLHGLSDRDPLVSVMTVPDGYNGLHLAEEPVKLFYIKKELHSLGESTMTTSFGRIVRCYDRERTLCDLIRSRSQMDLSLLNAAFKSYLRQKDKRVNLVFEYAEKLRVQKLVREYLEVLL